MPTIPETANVEAPNTNEAPVETNVVETKPALKTPKSGVKRSSKKGKKTMMKTAKPSKNGQPAKSNKVIKCYCGCGSPTGKRFAPGHDAQLKSRLLKAHRSDKGMSAKQKEMVKELGWRQLITK